ncbi:hypothetical protein ACIPL1_06140 [Pseudomonas sp. NPDC090202]|uniref:hypothetical protein n=1 Tax=unclassified Pseudomonas TaxID=196821 RepID=UPI00381473F3
MSSVNEGMIGRSVISFGNAGEQDRNDVLDCLALAEGAANQTAKASMNFLLWMYMYRSCLEERGFQLMAPAVHDTRIVVSADDFNRSIYKVLDQTGLRAVAMQSKAMFDAMGAVAFAERFFTDGGHNSATANFQILPYAQVVNGELMLFICGIGLTGRVDDAEHGSWTGERREMIMRVSCAAYSLNREVFATHRANIRETVGERGRRDILKLDL